MTAQGYDQTRGGKATTYPRTIGIIERERERRGLSQKQLAEALGITRQAVSYWETSGKHPGARALRQLCDLWNWDFWATYDELHKEHHAEQGTDQAVGRSAAQR